MALSKIDVANMLTGATPVANGGTGIASGTSGQFLKFTGSTTLASSAVSAGKVLQAVHTTSTANVTSNTTSFVTMNFNVQITPSATSSKILIMFNSGLGYQNTANENHYTYYTLYRDSTNLGAGNDGIQGTYFHTISYNDIFGHANFQKLDEPDTTSQITYTPYIRVNSSSVDFDTRLSGQHNLTALEIAA